MLQHNFSWSFLSFQVKYTCIGPLFIYVSRDTCSLKYILFDKPPIYSILECKLIYSFLYFCNPTVRSCYREHRFRYIYVIIEPGFMCREHGSFDYLLCLLLFIYQNPRAQKMWQPICSLKMKRLIN